MNGRSFAAVAALALVAFAAPAFADEVSDLKAELEAVKKRLADQERRVQSLSRDALTPEEVSASVDRYLESTSSAPVTLVGGEDPGKAGWPMGGAPFIQQGDNKINFHLRNQVRTEAFHYSKDAVGTLKSPPDTLSDAAPRDRSGFEVERLLFGVDGTIFCPAISFNLVLNFDSDQGSGVEKEYEWLDWRYAGDHHVRAGIDKVPVTYEDQGSSGTTAFVDRSLFAKAFGLDSDTGAMLWGTFGSCDCPKQFLYRVMASTGEGVVHSAGSVFNTDAFGTYGSHLLYSGCLEWNLTGNDWKWDEVDNRCEDRSRLDASLGAWAYAENDDDPTEKTPGLALRSAGPLDRRAFGCWFRARWEGWSLIAEAGERNVNYTHGSTAPDQTDWGAEATLHYRFVDSNWGVGVKYGVIGLDKDYASIQVGTSTVPIKDTITEVGFVVNYFFWDHGNKLTLDVTWVKDNSAVKSSSAGYLFDPKNGVVVEDGLMIRLQWQVSL